MKHSNDPDVRYRTRLVGPNAWVRMYDNGCVERILPRGWSPFNFDGSVRHSMAIQGWFVVGAIRED